MPKTSVTNTATNTNLETRLDYYIAIDKYGELYLYDSDSHEVEEDFFESLEEFFFEHNLEGAFDIFISDHTPKDKAVYVTYNRYEEQPMLFGRILEVYIYHDTRNEIEICKDKLLKITKSHTPPTHIILRPRKEEKKGKES